MVREKRGGGGGGGNRRGRYELDAKQDKMFGGSRGKLLATPTQLIYEAVDNASSSQAI